MNAKAYVNGELVDLSPEVAQAHLASQESPETTAVRAATAAIKSVVASKIAAIAPLHTQQNLATHRIDLMAKRASGETISAEDAALEAQAMGVARRIAAIRAAGKYAVEAGISADVVAWPE